MKSGVVQWLRTDVMKCQETYDAGSNPAAGAKRTEQLEKIILKTVIDNNDLFPGISRLFPEISHSFPEISYSFLGIHYPFPGICRSFPGIHHSFPGINHSFRRIQRSFPGMIHSFPFGKRADYITNKLFTLNIKQYA